MHVIDYSIFLKNFTEGKKIVFVGNAPSLSGEKLGSWIDGHDLVIRFNESPTTGYTDDVGARSDIVVTNPYPENRRPLSLSKHGLILLIWPQTRRPPSPELECWVGDHPVLQTYSPDLVGREHTEHKAGLTTGTYGIHLLSRLLAPASISITGFTMFFGETAHHYWQPETPKGVLSHELSVEAHVFIALCNAVRCRLEVTEEIRWLARKTGRELHNGISVRPLSNPRWLQ